MLESPRLILMSLRHTADTSSVCSLPPSRVEDARKRADAGGGLGRGVERLAPVVPDRTTPTPNPSPQGGGEHTERVSRLAHQTHRDMFSPPGRARRRPPRMDSSGPAPVEQTSGRNT